uniref:Uncharacterized protein n=1 Tax=Tanacetum cinerariifolium TaxID=118510 RepID=A0A699TTB3_TANCI|nr:hypothetical protein [Tanacetum cinerariifolium]
MALVHHFHARETEVDCNGDLGKTVQVNGNKDLGYVEFAFLRVRDVIQLIFNEFGEAICLVKCGGVIDGYLLLDVGKKA